MNVVAIRQPNTAPRRPEAQLPTRPGVVVHGRLRLVKAGPLVPARCWVVDGDRDPETGELLSDQRLAYQLHTDQPRWADDWWPRGWPWRPITAAEWQHLMDLTAWARQWQPDHPLCNPRQPIAREAAPIF